MKQKHPLRSRITKVVEDQWPTHIKGICKELGMDPEKNADLSKVKYHVDQLVKQEQFHKKKIGMASVVWPVAIERLRVIYELVKEE